MKITIDKQKCIGCGNCWALCDKFFEVGDDNKSSLKGSSNGYEMEIEEVDCAQEAVDTCPVQCIKLSH
ncbi:MAG: ferredoxin [Candidatus Pacebacteria bacterium]|nr:ferredoxin [Candidatus Paceibacterota bacterium]